MTRSSLSSLLLANLTFSVTNQSAGLIDDRTATINPWLRQKLDELDPGEPLS